MTDKYDFLKKYEKDFVGTRYQPKSLIPLRYADMLILNAEEMYSDLSEHLTGLGIPDVDRRLNFMGVFIRQLRNLRVKNHVMFFRKIMQITEIVQFLLEKSKAFAIKDTEKESSKIERIVQMYKEKK